VPDLIFLKLTIGVKSSFILFMLHLLLRGEGISPSILFGEWFSQSVFFCCLPGESFEQGLFFWRITLDNKRADAGWRSA